MANIEAVDEATQRQEGNGSQENRIERLAREISISLETPRPPLTFNCCIYKTPDVIRKQNKAAYSPNVVSIGPYHHGKSKLEYMEKFKSTYVKNFLERVRNVGLLEDYLRTLTGLEDRIRKCYAEQVKMSSGKFLRMIITDSCFIFEYFLRLDSNQQWAVEDHVLLKPWLVGAIYVDLILLENQIPFFVLKQLYDMAFPEGSGIPFTDLTSSFFNDLKVNVLEHNAEVVTERVEHFTHLIREFFLPPTDERLEWETSSQIVEHLPSASQLHEIGLKFRAVRGNGSIHLRFGNGQLEMAPFKVYDDIEIHIRNVMAFEQCHYADNHYVSQYMFLLDFLINTAKDVELLVDKGIITNALGDSKAVATMVNSLRKNIITPGVHSHYHEVCCQVNKFYRSRYHRWCTNLRRDYCGTPWKIVGSAAAVLLIVFTFVQNALSFRLAEVAK